MYRHAKALIALMFSIERKLTLTLVLTLLALNLVLETLTSASYCPNGRSAIRAGAIDAYRCAGKRHCQ